MTSLTKMNKRTSRASCYSSNTAVKLWTRARGSNLAGRAPKENIGYNSYHSKEAIETLIESVKENKCREKKNSNLFEHKAYSFDHPFDLNLFLRFILEVIPF